MMKMKENIGVNRNIVDNFWNVLKSAREESGQNEFSQVVEKCIENENDISGIDDIIYGQIMDRVDIESQTIYKTIEIKDIKLVDEKQGTSVSLLINGDNYRYVSPNKSSQDLINSFNGVIRHGNTRVKALKWLDSNAVLYYKSK